jgi:hypothetical protein
MCLNFHFKDSPLTNAGVGSNLTLHEKVECDASIMDKDGFGSVGALGNIKNPIMVSLSLLEAQSKGTLSMGRIVPWYNIKFNTWSVNFNYFKLCGNFLKACSSAKEPKSGQERTISNKSTMTS